jgi:peptidoglycan L-alanyl-D-glutamate endopeptidase CwlK
MHEQLRHGDSGNDRNALQQALAEHGFSGGPLDGDYRQGRVAAVMAFQKSGESVLDGVAGPRTLFALGRAGPERFPSGIAALLAAKRPAGAARR